MKSSIAILMMIASCQLNAQCWQALYTGAGFSIAEKTDGTLWSCGQDNWGQLGNGVTSTQTLYTFAQINADTDWQSVSVGYNQVLAIKSDGTLWAWGSNQMGQLGDGTTNSKNVPTQIGTDTNWHVISAGTNFSTAIKTDGTIWAWGMNYYGQLGTGNTIDKLVPTKIGNATNWAKVSAGVGHTVAIKTNGTLWSWGSNQFGELGIGSQTNNYLPIQIGSNSTWSFISCGNSYTIALRSNGQMWSWGSNFNGQLGNGTNSNSNNPIQIGIGSTWGTIAAGSDFVIAKKANGSIWSWGNNDNGQLGLNLGILPNGLNIPTQIGSDVDWDFYSASKYRHVLAVKGNGQLWAWGSNTGCLGNGSFGAEFQPVLSTNCILLNTNDNNIPSFTIYPNPANDFLNIQINENRIVNSIILTDIFGKIVHSQSENLTKINISQLQKGMYLLQLDYELGKQIVKFIKE
jgi:alpha-tubulin suppressor-like RCC1 family protein